ncbi:MAG: hypothetical protein A3G25_11820 [Betaproteobacteria bacterium RIFCSPLOWO2_12_FULL_63_13]|nr:MAG: hypothetical protein A3G25_11820 [Betaproteobacteria bacterium RIFCSPLOWO2_12_FULL_63_13]
MQRMPGRLRPSGRDWMQAGLVSAALFVLYAITAPRTVAEEDDGLFVLSSYFLGIEHPPGYPLFTIVGHLFTYLPLGSVAYRVHLASAMFGGLTCAAAWLCARALLPGRMPAYVAALGLGLSPVFWSQAIIAEVYTLNTFFFLSLVFLGLQACPPAGGDPGEPRSARLLAWIALVFGLSLSNHYPLMLLVAPAFVLLLWPLRAELLKRLWLLVLLVVLGLLPYVWLVYRSWAALPISFYGPMETLHEIWYFISRSGYVRVDQSATANWLDRIKFFQFQAGELMVQFAVIGTAAAAAGFVVQWRVWGRRVAAFFTAAFLLSSIVLLLLLGFDYDSIHKNVYQVYPLPAYAVAALWMGLGLAWFAGRYALNRHRTVATGVFVIAIVAGVGARYNMFDDHDWIARYAKAVLKTLPRNAVVFGRGDPDLVPMAYFHMIETVRPDISLYQPRGLVLGNRLFHPERTDDETASRILKRMVAEQKVPVVATLDAYTFGAQRDRWLYTEFDRSSSDAKKVTVDIPEEAARFFETSVMHAKSSNAWVAFVQGQLRHRYAVLLARSLSRHASPDERTRRHLKALEKDFYGALGIAEGLMLNSEGYSVGAVTLALETARDRMPSDVPKEFLARYFYLGGAMRAGRGDRSGAVGNLETALSIWHSPKNPAIATLETLLREAGDSAALQRLQDRVKTFKRSLRR